MIFLGLLAYFFLKPKVNPKSPDIQSILDVAPTLTQAEKDIISNMKTFKVEIFDNSINPPKLSIKKYDQVAFYNNTTDQTISIDGEGWGGVLIKPGQNMTKPFREIGKFKYQVTLLGLDGEILVEN